MRKVLFLVVLFVFASTTGFAEVKTKYLANDYYAETEFWAGAGNESFSLHFEKRLKKGGGLFRGYQEILGLEISVGYGIEKRKKKVKSGIHYQIDDNKPRHLTTFVDTQYGTKIYVDPLGLAKMDSFDENSKVKLIVTFRNKTQNEIILTKNNVKDWVTIRNYTFTEEEKINLKAEDDRKIEEYKAKRKAEKEEKKRQKEEKRKNESVEE